MNGLQTILTDILLVTVTLGAGGFGVLTLFSKADVDPAIQLLVALGAMAVGILAGQTYLHLAATRSDA